MPTRFLPVLLLCCTAAEPIEAKSKKDSVPVVKTDKHGKKTAHWPDDTPAPSKDGGR